MPVKGWKAITVSAEILEKAKRFIEEENKKAGGKKYRSIAHLTEMAILDYLKTEKNTDPKV